MAILKRIKEVFEISSDNGLINIYALRRVRGEGGKPDPKLAALLGRNTQKLERQRKMAMLESKGTAVSIRTAR